LIFIESFSSYYSDIGSFCSELEREMIHKFPVKKDQGFLFLLRYSIEAISVVKATNWKNRKHIPPTHYWLERKSPEIQNRSFTTTLARDEISTVSGPVNLTEIVPAMVPGIPSITETNLHRIIGGSIT